MFALEPGIGSSKSEVSSFTSATIRDADPFLDSCGKPNDR